VLASPALPPSSFVNALEQGLSFLFFLLLSTHQAVSLLDRLLGNWLLQRARWGSGIEGDSTWTLTVISFFTLLFRVIGVEVSAAAASLGRSALGS